MNLLFQDDRCHKFSHTQQPLFVGKIQPKIKKEIYLNIRGNKTCNIVFWLSVAYTNVNNKKLGKTCTL